MNKRRLLLFAISGMFATLCGQGHAVKSFGTKKQILFLSYDGQRYEIPTREEIVSIDLPPNKYFEIETTDLDDLSVHSRRSYSFRVPFIPTKPLHFVLDETNTLFIIYPRGIPWLAKQSKTI